MFRKSGDFAWNNLAPKVLVGTSKGGMKIEKHAYLKVFDKL